jgi:hypothetical protein
MAPVQSASDVVVDAVVALLKMALKQIRTTCRKAAVSALLNQAQAVSDIERANGLTTHQGIRNTPASIPW